MKNIGYLLVLLLLVMSASASMAAVGGTQNTVWNAGFTAVDPTDAVDHGSIGNHIIVPDSVIPEPSSMMALGAGLMGLSGLVIRRRRT